MSAAVDGAVVAGEGLPPFAAQRAMVERLLADPDRLHHALLLAGPPGIGKAAVAATIARSLLCETPVQARSHPPFACGACPSCGWVAAGQHPDLRIVTLETGREGKLASELSIDQVRDLESFVGMTAFRGGRRVIVVDPADTLSVPAANALLKRLEEPGERTVFLLVTHRADRLPATVRSRCRPVPVPAPGPDEARAWLSSAAEVAPPEAVRLLAFAGGAPLHALALADPANLTVHRSLVEAIGSLPETAEVVVAERIGAAGATHWYPILQRWVADLVRVRAGASPRFFPESASRLQQLARLSTLSALTQASIRLQRQANLVRHPLNPRMFAETSLALVADAFDERSRRVPLK